MFIKAGGTLARGPEFSNHWLIYSSGSEILKGLNKLTYLKVFIGSGCGTTLANIDHHY